MTRKQKGIELKSYAAKSKGLKRHIAKLAENKVERQGKHVPDIIKSLIKKGFIRDQWDYDKWNRIIKLAIKKGATFKKHIEIDDFLDIQKEHFEEIRQIKDERDGYKKEYELLRNALKKAYAAYNEDGKRQDVRARNALRILGFTISKRPKKINRIGLWYEYIRLITGSLDSGTVDIVELYSHTPNPIGKKEAIEHMAKKHKMSVDAIYQHLKIYVAAQREKHGPKWNGGQAILPQIKPR
ncbi:MAG: hypothetical protein NT072_11980 [Deltaproteobacteria bacterium]|nr:hypothetical protein [Deltaproteobacteria bacterium]